MASSQSKLARNYRVGANATHQGELRGDPEGLFESELLGYEKGASTSGLYNVWEALRLQRNATSG
jgi:hypothetical protein